MSKLLYDPPGIRQQYKQKSITFAQNTDIYLSPRQIHPPKTCFRLMLLTLMFSMNLHHKDFYLLGQVVKVCLTLVCTHKKGNLDLVWFTL